MALIANDAPNVTRLTQLEVVVRGAHGGGNEPSIHAGGVVPVNIKIPAAATQTVPAFRIQRVAAGVVTDLYTIDSSGGVTVGAISDLVSYRAKFSVSSANILAMYTTPVLVLAAPATGKAIVVQQILFEMTTTATAYANGGIVLFQYDSTANGGGVQVHAGSVAAAAITAGAGTTVQQLVAASSTTTTIVTKEKGIYISNQTAPFITGTGTAKVWIDYQVLTL
jgi:hypothetical protein